VLAVAGAGLAAGLGLAPVASSSARADPVAVESLRRPIARALDAASGHADIAARAPRLRCGATLAADRLGDQPSPGAALERAVDRATGGGVICLSAGLPKEIDLYNLHPKRTVTIEPAPGVRATQVGSDFDLESVSNVRLVGMTLSFLLGGRSTNDSISDNLINGTTWVRDTPVNANIHVADNSALDVRSAADDGVFSVEDTGPPNCPDGVTVEHNLVDGTNEDGLATMGEACGTRFVANRVENIIQAHCGAIHCDGFQDNGGGMNTILSGNMFYNDTDCWLGEDGSVNTTIVDNVCSTSDDSSYWMLYGGAQSLTLNHNTITSVTGASYGNDHRGDRSSKIALTNNIFYSAPTRRSGEPVSGLIQRYNLCGRGCGGGSNELSGRPRLVGGPEPTTWLGFRLVRGSRGLRNASDGLNRGVGDFAAMPGPHT
jgi:hypothetical protein